MQTIRLAVVRDRRWAPTDGYQVFGDGGSGVIDWAHPLTSRRRLLWDDVPPLGSHLDRGHLVGPHLSEVREDGHLEGTHLADDHLYPAAALVFEVGPLVFGRFRLAVAMADAAGNVAASSAAVRDVVINSHPPGPWNLLPVSFDVESSRMVFSFEPSDRLVG